MTSSEEPLAELLLGRLGNRASDHLHNLKRVLGLKQLQFPETAIARQRC
ncbi:hypothetical protein NEA10_02155 [Phormidium yuhuli AB48]|uniref:Uncharacterized protein n=1 Tax=Phormidium yuhuli AB48 TaxID=2940671 RepID=A0ABY5ATI2_9CYAN|nr:hypothetical protein [Phormidium yuhuli]USR91554.1 hypothetical protein NEA10_02155 [Phormidium yuhuli AB48]